MASGGHEWVEEPGPAPGQQVGPVGQRPEPVGQSVMDACSQLLIGLDMCGHPSNWLSVAVVCM